MEEDFVQDVESFPAELLNDRNKHLSSLVKQKQAKKREVQRQLDEQQERIQVLKEHLKNVKNEIFHTQILINAKDKETETENHLRMIAEREIHYLLDEMKEIDRKITETTNRISNDKTEVFKGNEKLDQLKLKIGFNQEELEQWSLAEKQKGDDLIAIERYRRKDDQKISALSLQLEKLQKEYDRLKYAVQVEITETQTSQIELDKTAEDFRREHLEREQLVEKYEDTLKMMKKREEMIEEYERELGDVRGETRDFQEELVSQKEELELQQVNTREVRGHIARITRLNEKKKEAIEAKKREEYNSNEELINVRQRVSKVTTELNNARLAKKQLQEGRVKLKVKLEKVEKREEKLSREVDLNFGKLRTLEERRKYMENQLKNYEKREKKILDVINELKEFLYKKQEELHKRKRKEANLVAEISGSRAQSKNLQSKIAQMDQEAYKQQELLYNIGYSIQQMERRVNRAQGQRTQEQTEKLKKTIDKLTRQLEDTEKKHAILNTEWKKAQGEVRKHAVLVKGQETEKVKEKEAVNELVIQNNSHEKEIKRKSAEREDLMVQHDLLKLQVRALGERLRMKSKEVCGLENRKYQMELTYQEKEHRLEAMLKILRAELKATKQEKRAITMDLNNRKSTVEKLKDKFGILLRRIKTDDEGEEITQAGFLIQAIQEREELQRRGDYLDAQIQKLEKESGAIENTLKLFRLNNMNHLGSLGRPNMSDGNFQKKARLEEDINRIDTLIGEKIQERNSAKENLADVQNVNHQLMEVRDELDREMRNYNEESQVIHEEKLKLEMKLRNTLKIKRDYVGRLERKKKQAIKVKDTKAKTDQVLSALNELASSEKTFQALFSRLLQESGLTVPDSRPTSSRSNISSRSTRSRPSRPTTASSFSRSRPASSRASYSVSMRRSSSMSAKKATRSARTTPRVAAKKRDSARRSARSGRMAKSAASSPRNVLSLSVDSRKKKPGTGKKKKKRSSKRK